MAGDVGGSASATKFSGTPAQNTATGNPSVGTQGTMQGLGAMGDGAGMSSGMGAGGKGGGGMQPQKTAMGTPIVYGNTYLPNPVSGQPNAGVPVTPTYDPASDGGGFEDGTMSVPAYAYGSMSVPAYAYGTESVAGYARGTMGVDDDPWSWTNQQPIAAPLSVEIKPSNEQPGGRVADPVQQQLGSMALTKGIDATEKGVTAGYNAYKAAGPLATSQLASADMALGNLGGTAGAEALAAGSTLAEGGALASALGAGGSAGMAALMATPAAPIVATILAGKLLKKVI